MQELIDLAAFLNIPPAHISNSGNLAVPVLHDNSGMEIRGLVSISKHLARNSSRAELLGHTAEEKALVNQWMEYRITKIDPCENDVRSMQGVLKELNSYLTDKVFFVGHRFTLADVLLYRSLHRIFMELSFYDKQHLIHLSRWFNQVQHTPGVKQHLSEVFFQRSNIYTSGAVP